MLEDPLANASLTLAISIAVLGLILFLVKKYTPKLRGITPTTDFKIEARLPLAHKSSLFIVSVEGRRLLIGSGESSVNLIGELETGCENNNFPDAQNLALAKEEKSFSSFLKQSFSQQKA